MDEVVDAPSVAVEHLAAAIVERVVQERLRLDVPSAPAEMDRPGVRHELSATRHDRGRSFRPGRADGRGEPPGHARYQIPGLVSDELADVVMELGQIVETIVHAPECSSELWPALDLDRCSAALRGHP